MTETQAGSIKAKRKQWPQLLPTRSLDAPNIRIEALHCNVRKVSSSGDASSGTERQEIQEMEEEN